MAARVGNAIRKRPSLRAERSNPEFEAKLDCEAGAAATAGLLRFARNDAGFPGAGRLPPLATRHPRA